MQELVRYTHCAVSYFVQLFQSNSAVGCHPKFICLFVFFRSPRFYHAHSSTLTDSFHRLNSCPPRLAPPGGGGDTQLRSQIRLIYEYRIRLVNLPSESTLSMSIVLGTHDVPQIGNVVRSLYSAVADAICSPLLHHLSHLPIRPTWHVYGGGPLPRFRILLNLRIER